MAKLTLNDVTNLNTSSAATTLNNNNTLLEAALEKTLSRDGSSPNTMSADLDMNGNDLLNVNVLNATTLRLAGTDTTVESLSTQINNSVTAAATSAASAATSAASAAASANTATTNAAEAADSATSAANSATSATNTLTPFYAHAGSGGSAHALATTSTAGFMSVADKTLLGTALQSTLHGGEDRVVDPTFLNAASWTNGTITNAGDIPTWGQLNVIDITGNASAYVAALSSVFPVTAGEKLFASCRAAITGGSGASVYLTVHVSATPDMASPTQLYVAATTNTTATDISGVVTIPSGARYGQFRVYKPGNASVTSCRFSLPHCTTDISALATALQPGSYGLGQVYASGTTPLLSSLDDVTVASGFYRATNTTTGTFPTTAVPCFVLVERYSGSWVKQTLTYRGDATDYGKTYVRTYNSTAWRSWKQVTYSDDVSAAVLATALSGLSTATATAITTSDTVLSGLGKLQAQVTSVLAGSNYKGVWNASTNSPTITAGVGTNGDFYIVSTAGTQSITGTSVTFTVGDTARFNGTAWQRVPSFAAVSSVAGKTGAVTLVRSDVGLGNVDNTSDANKPVSTAQNTAINNRAPLSHVGASGTGEHPAATTSVAGFMSSSDKAHLDSADMIFINVATMVAATNLTTGLTVRTLGYYNVGDGGGNSYQVVAAATGTADGGSFINLTGSGLQARAVMSGNWVRAETFGCVDGRECSAQLIAANAYLLSVMVSLPGPTSRTEQGLLTLNSNILIKDQIELGNASGLYTNIDFRGGWIRVTSGGNLANAPTTPAVTLRGTNCEHHLCPILCDKYCSGWLITAVQNSKIFSPMTLDFASDAAGFGVKMNNCRGAAIYHPIAVEWTSAWTTQAPLSTSYVGTDIVVDGWDFTIYGGHYGWAGKSIWFTANAGYVTWIAMHPYCNKAIITGLNSSGQATTDTDQMVSYTDVRMNPIAVLNDAPASIFLNEPYVDGGYVVDNTGTLQITGGFHYISGSAGANGALTAPYTRIKASVAPGFTANQFRSSFGFFDTDYTTLNAYSAAWASGTNGLSPTGPLPFVGRQFQMYFTSAFTDTPNVEEVSRSASPIRHRYSFANGAYIDELYEDGQSGTKTVFAKRLTVDGTTLGQAATYLVLGNANHGFRLDSDDLDLNFLMANTARWKIDNTAYAFQPAVDNAYNLGSASLRVKAIYAGTGTINTSDERCKTDIDVIPDNVLDAWGNVGWSQFKFIDSVNEKGDKARLHSGMIAQKVVEVFSVAGLNAADYGLLCYDKWDATPAITEEQQVLTTPAVMSGEEVVVPAVYKTETVVIQPAIEAGDRYGIRYEEALCMEAAYQRRRADRLEARIAALEVRLGV